MSKAFCLLHMHGGRNLPALRAVWEDREYRSLIHTELGFEAVGKVRVLDMSYTLGFFQLFDLYGNHILLFVYLSIRRIICVDIGSVIDFPRVESVLCITYRLYTLYVEAPPVLIVPIVLLSGTFI